MRLGDRRSHLPILLVEWRPGFDGLRRHPWGLWSHCCCAVAGRNGLHVRLSLATPSLELNTVGLPTFHFSPLGSGNFFKVGNGRPEAKGAVKGFLLCPTLDNYRRHG